MAVAVITPPTPFISREEAKRHIIVEHDDDDQLIDSFVAAACAWLDGPAGWLGRAIGVQELEFSDWLACARTPLPFPPCLEIVSITARDDDGNVVTADPDTYTVDAGRLVVSPGATWVTLDDHRVRYWAGYGEKTGDPAAWSTKDVPPPIKVAALMMAAQWFRNRAPVVIGSSVEQLPFGVEALLSPYRVYR